MNAIRERMRRITHDLNALREELTTLEHSGVRELIEEMLTVEVTQHFKSSVDAVRHLLWIYIEAVAQAKAPGEVDYEVQALRLQRAVEILRSLREGSVPVNLNNHGSFVDHVSALVDRYSSEPARSTAVVEMPVSPGHCESWRAGRP
jgi:hypothetical protein